jgi:hypothetical protein
VRGGIVCGSTMGLILAISLPGAIQMTFACPIAVQEYWLPGVALDDSCRIVTSEWFFCS